MLEGRGGAAVAVRRHDGPRSKMQSRLTANGWLQSGPMKMIWIDGKMMAEASGSARPIGTAGEIKIRWQGRDLAIKPGQTAYKGPQGRIRVREFESD